MELKKWSNLLNETCPKCNSSLSYKKDSELYECALYNEDSDSFFSCDFSISPLIMKNLQQKIMNGRTLSDYAIQDNLKELNNYGVKPF